ncbi:zinc finger, C2H2 type [Oesophagostomum dentatum]|uniref:Zinc finger, C2H2 type n=1 Tax=Oesophagostomum dentatum TaxID=61180 RepID=A0A0B1RWP1_OESDE|nr:zinc finger, C2H2 type [Oesophagostomum dentatum]
MLCGYCGENQPNIVDHLLEAHEKQITVSFKLIQCPCCKEQFEYSDHYEDHIQKHFDENKGASEEEI